MLKLHIEIHRIPTFWTLLKLQIKFRSINCQVITMVCQLSPSKLKIFQQKYGLQNFNNWKQCQESTYHLDKLTLWKGISWHVSNCKICILSKESCGNRYIFKKWLIFGMFQDNILQKNIYTGIHVPLCIDAKHPSRLKLKIVCYF